MAVDGTITAEVVEEEAIAGANVVLTIDSKLQKITEEVLKTNIEKIRSGGFGKTYEQNLLVLKHLEDFVNLGYPVLLGTSRKSVIGLTLDLPADEREEGTQVTTALAVQCGCQFVRVHNVKGNVRTIRMMEAIKNA